METFSTFFMIVLAVLPRTRGAASNWMQYVGGDEKLKDLGIPGTHDSGAYDMPTDIGEAQDWNIEQQLHHGVRFLDIRLSNRGQEDDFEIRHGKLRLGSFKKLVMQTVKNFLKEFPSESIFMSIKPEGKLDINRLESYFIRNTGYKFYQGLVTGSTELKTVRGKVVLFKRYKDTSYSANVGIKWNQLNIQDHYNLGVECKEVPIMFRWTKKVCSALVGLDYPKKAREVVDHLKKASRSNTNQISVNFASANWKGMYIGNNAKVTNQAVKKFFTSIGRVKRVGSIVVMDYPNRNAGVIDSIIDNNSV